MPRFEGDLRPLPATRYAIVVSRWNPRITEALLAGAQAALLGHGISTENVTVVHVPGVWELPVTAAVLAKSKKYSALIALGCVIRGETRHYEHIADECAHGLMQVSLDQALPISNGVLAVEVHAHAEARAGGVHGNKGEEAALAALEMVHLFHQISSETYCA